MSTKCKEILEELAIPCNYIEGHEPVLNYEVSDDEDKIRSIRTVCYV